MRRQGSEDRRNGSCHQRSMSPPGLADGERKGPGIRKPGVLAGLRVNADARESTLKKKTRLISQYEEMNKLEIRTSFTLPSMQHDMNWSFLTLDQSTPNTSCVCSCQARMGKFYITCRTYSHRRSSEGSEVRVLTFNITSQSFMEPSPDTVTSWFSWTSDHARSYRLSCVS